MKLTWDCARLCSSSPGSLSSPITQPICLPCPAQAGKVGLVAALPVIRIPTDKDFTKERPLNINNSLLKFNRFFYALHYG